MVDIRVTYSKKDELDKIIKSLNEKHNIISISKAYCNSRNLKKEEYRVYIKIEM